jgi:CubicO group peptidase (beta-lactamase class C family)
MRFLVSVLGASIIAGGSAGARTQQPPIFPSVSGPGVMVFAIQDGKWIEKQGIGYAHLQKKLRIGSNTHFRLASNSKAFTAAAILLLEQDGKLLDADPMGKFFPEFPKSLQAIEVRHLVHHTSGLPDYGEICTRSEVSREKVTNTQILEWLKAHPELSFTPGTKWEYSNTGYVLLASLVERVSGQSFPDFVKKRIFEPLGMSSSRYFNEATENSIPDRALGYGPWPWFEVNDRDSCNYSSGDDGIYTNIEDYGRWLTGLQGGKLFKPEFQKKVFTPGSTPDGKSTGYAYGWVVSGEGEGRVVSHSGAWVGFRSAAVYRAKENLWFGFLSNYQGVPQDFVTRIQERYLKPASPGARVRTQTQGR